MMGGLAYMTGRPAGRCAPAPASTTSWAACSAPSAILAALRQREQTGRGKRSAVSALFENNVFLVAQHMMQFAAHRQGAAADAGSRSGLGRVRRVRTARRRADLSSAW